MAANIHIKNAIELQVASTCNTRVLHFSPLEFWNRICFAVISVLSAPASVVQLLYLSNISSSHLKHLKVLFAIFLHKYDCVHVCYQYCNVPSIFKMILGISYDQTFPVQWAETFFFLVKLSHFVIL